MSKRSWFNIIRTWYLSTNPVLNQSQLSKLCKFYQIRISWTMRLSLLMRATKKVIIVIKLHQFHTKYDEYFYKKIPSKYLFRNEILNFFRIRRTFVACKSGLCIDKQLQAISSSATNQKTWFEVRSRSSANFNEQGKEWNYLLAQRFD